MRLEALKTQRHTALKHYLEAGYQAIVAMLPPKAQSKCSVLLMRLSCTTMFQILVRSAVYTQAVDGTQERKQMHANASGFVHLRLPQEKKKHNSHVNRLEPQELYT